MKHLAVLLFAIPLFGQAPATQTPAQPADQQAAQAAQAQAPTAAAEQWLTGYIDLGYRFRTDVQGSMDTYRSVVNLNEGPRLFGIDFTVQDPKKRLFDRLDARGFNWGDPYNTAQVEARKQRIYDFRFDYRNVLYFNALPSFANPFAPGGYNERAFDVTRRTAFFHLDLFPASRIVPYVAYDRSSGFGSGVSTWVLSGNEYAVPTSYREHSNNYRGGLRVELRRFHVTVEQGGTTFKDDEAVYDTTTRSGNRTAPVGGRNLMLQSLQQSYGIRADSIYSRGLVTASPFSWLNAQGAFLYSRPRTDVNYVALASGVLGSTALFYNAQSDSVTGSVNKPHVSGNAGFELRPFRRLRILYSWQTDRFHDSAYTTIASQIFLTATTPGALTQGSFTDPLAVNYNRSQTDLLFDVTTRITLRGGHRYEWGDSRVRPGELTSEFGPTESGSLSRQVALAGINVRPFQRLSVNADYEGASTARAYFKTSLYNYTRFRARARYQPVESLSVQAAFNVLDNDNPVPGVLYDFLSRNNTVSLHWTPGGGRRFSALAEYDRATIRSEANYLDLPFLTPAVSRYRDDAHLATAAFDFGAPAIHAVSPRLTLGGSLAITNGTRPQRFYQPLARLSVPFTENVAWVSQWQWHALNQSLYFYERFQTHLFQTGVRISR